MSNKGQIVFYNEIDKKKSNFKHLICCNVVFRRAQFMAVRMQKNVSLSRRMSKDEYAKKNAPLRTLIIVLNTYGCVVIK